MATKETETLNELISWARMGDEAAWEKLFARLGDENGEGKMLLATARKLLPAGDAARDILDSRDLTQSTLRSGWDDLSDFRGTTVPELRSWLKSIPRRKITRALRRKRPQRLGQLLQQTEDEKHSNGADNPLADLIREELHSRLNLFLRQLPEDMRNIMELRIAGMSSARIAERLGMTPAAVRKRKSRAMERLRQLISGVV